MPRTGVIGEQIFEQVEKLVNGGMSRTDAFKKISADSGRREGTVAANYYRVARKRAGGSLRPRRRPAGARRATATTTRTRRTAAGASGSGDIDALTRSLVQNVQALAAAMNAQAAEVKDLRTRLERARSLLG
ncbi:MAG TPA: hypothetical protein VFI18_10625 [Gaiellales bacterium]|nr:hypothetical protein [Gaiellales bacterium]